MRLDHAARLERLLARRPDIAAIDGVSGNGTLVVRDQLLVGRRDADSAHHRAARWVAERRDHHDASVTVLHLRQEAKIDVSDLAAALAASGQPGQHRRLNVSPNHVMTAAPHWGAGPFDEPAPTDSVPPVPRDAATGGAAAGGAVGSAGGGGGGGRDSRTVRVAILDTGIAAHPWFTAQQWFAECGPDVLEIADADRDRRLDSVAGHGTFIAGVVMQHAPTAHIMVSRIIDGDGVTNELDLVRGLTHVRSHAKRTKTAIDVVSLSLGCYSHDDNPSPVLQQAIDAFEPSTVVVACAGNAASSRPFWPAALKRVVAVASLNADGTDRSSFSNYGWWVDASTVGDRVVSTFFDYAGMGPNGEEKFTGFATWSGTSFAAPRVAGVIATTARRHGVSAVQAASHLLDRSTKPSMPDLGVLVDTPETAEASEIAGSH